MADIPDITQLPGSGSVSKPDSGTYGDVTALQDLKKGTGLGEAPPGPPGPDVSTMPGSAQIKPSSGPFGLPSAITAPTQQPDTPVGTPLAAAPVNPVAQAGAPNQQRLAFLDMLARNPDVSDTTREWAQTVMAKLIQATRQ